MLCPGQVYRASYTLKNAAGPPSQTTLVITRYADAHTDTFTGPWTWAQAGADYTTTYDYTLTLPGLYKLVWATQGPGTAPRPEFLHVDDYLSIVSLAETKLHLNLTRDDDDDELGGYLADSTELVESKVGPCVPRQFTWLADIGTPTAYQLLVPHKPLMQAVSVTSVLTAGFTYGSAVLAVDGPAGIIYQPSGLPFEQGPWNCVHQAGRTVVPSRFRRAALE